VKGKKGIPVDENKNAELERDELRAVLSHVLMAANMAFDFLARDNTYTPAVNQAWRALGTGLVRLQSSDPPATPESIARFLFAQDGDA